MIINKHISRLWLLSVLCYLNLNGQTNFTTSFGLGSENSTEISETFISPEGNIVALSFTKNCQQTTFTILNNQGLVIDQNTFEFIHNGFRVYSLSNKVFIASLQNLGNVFVNINQLNLKGESSAFNPIYPVIGLYEMFFFEQVSGGSYIIVGNDTPFGNNNCLNDDCKKVMLLFFDSELNFINSLKVGENNAIYTPLKYLNYQNEHYILSLKEDVFETTDKVISVLKVSNNEFDWELELPYHKDEIIDFQRFIFEDGLEQDVYLFASVYNNHPDSLNCKVRTVFVEESGIFFSENINAPAQLSKLQPQAIKIYNNSEIIISGNKSLDEQSDVFMFKTNIENEVLCFNTFDVPNSIAKINHILPIDEDNIILSGGSELNGLVIKTNENCESFPLKTNPQNFVKYHNYFKLIDNQFIQFNLPKNITKVDYQLFNNVGQLVKKGTAFDDELILIDNFNDGMYLIQLTFENEFITSQKIVKL